MSKGNTLKRLSLLVLCLAFGSVFAHPSFDHENVRAGRLFKADLMVTHGCGNSPTIRVIVDIPEEVMSVTPRAKPGWTIETVESKLSASRTVFGMQVTKYTSQVIWSGGSLSSDYFDVFSFIIIPPGEATTLYFPTTQICSEGVDSYTAIPDPNKPDEHLADSAPTLTVIESTQDKGH